MSTISPGYLLDISGAGEPVTVAQSNFERLSADIYKVTPSASTTTIGPPTTGTHVLDEVWVDYLGARWRCTAAGTPGTWVQQTPAIVTSEPTTGVIPSDYLISQSGTLKTHDGSYVWKPVNAPFGPLVRRGGLHFPGPNAACAECYAATGYAIGTGEFSLLVEFTVPTSAPSTQQFIAVLSSTFESESSSAFRIYLATDGSLTLQFGTTSGTLAHRRAVVERFISKYGGTAATVTVTRNSGTLTVYVNGESVDYIELAIGAAPEWSASVNSTYINLGYRLHVDTSASTQEYPAGELNQFLGTIYTVRLWNEALTAAEVLTAHRHGLGHDTNVLAASTLYTSDFSAGVDSWTGTRITLTGNIDVGGEGDALRGAVSITDADHYATRTVGMTPGCRYRIGFSYYVDSVTNTAVKAIQLRDSAGGRLSAPFVPDAAGWNTVSFVATPTAADLRFYALTLGLNTIDDSFSGAAELLYVKGITVESVGLILDLDCAVGVGRYIPDRSPANNFGTIVGQVAHTLPRRSGDIVVIKELAHSEISSSAATTELLQLPPYCAITEIEFDVTTTFDAAVTCDVGISGTADKFVADQAMDASGRALADSSSKIAESSTVYTPVYIQKSGATTQGAVTLRIVMRVRG